MGRVPEEHRKSAVFFFFLKLSFFASRSRLLTGVACPCSQKSGQQHGDVEEKSGFFPLVFTRACGASSELATCLWALRTTSATSRAKCATNCRACSALHAHLLRTRVARTCFLCSRTPLGAVSAGSQNLILKVFHILLQKKKKSFVFSASSSLANAVQLRKQVELSDTSEADLETAEKWLLIFFRSAVRGVWSGGGAR